MPCRPMPRNAVPHTIAIRKSEIDEIHGDIDERRKESTVERNAETTRRLIAAEVPPLRLADVQRAVAAARRALRMRTKRHVAAP